MSNPQLANMLKLLFGGQKGVQRPGGSVPATQAKSPAQAIPPVPDASFKGQPQQSVGVAPKKAPSLGELVQQGNWKR